MVTAYWPVSTVARLGLAARTRLYTTWPWSLLLARDITARVIRTEAE